MQKRQKSRREYPGPLSHQTSRNWGVAAREGTAEPRTGAQDGAASASSLSRVALPTPSQGCARPPSGGDLQNDLGAEHPLQGGILQELGALEPDAVSAEVQVLQGLVVEEHGGQARAADGGELALPQPAGGKEGAERERPASERPASRAVHSPEVTVQPKGDATGPS